MKRILDVVGSVAGLVVLAPVIAGVAAAVRVGIGRPVLFRQVRAGRHGRPFALYKFRTMTDGRDAAGTLLSDAERLTRLGGLLRRTSLDELPGLWNVLRGDMSLVGPRPLLMEYLPHYTERQRRRHDVRPGITGLAQINGRQTVSFSKRIEMDVEYVEQQSLWLDLKILLLTVPRVFGSRGVVLGQEVEEVDDLGLSVDLPSRNPSPERSVERASQTR